MTPEAAASSPVFYGIVKDRPVIDFVRALSSKARDAINMVFDDLQFNPRPQGHETSAIDPHMLYYLVETISPNYTITYKVDETNLRVLIFSIAETNFRHRQ